MNEMKKNNLLGYTVMEMIIALAIIGIFSMIAIPYTLDWRSQRSANNASIGVMTELLQAKMLSAQRNANVIVAFDLANNTLKIYLDLDRDGIDDGDLQKTVTLSSLESSMRFSYNPGLGVNGESITRAAMMGNTVNPVRVTFMPDGQVRNYGTVYMIPIQDIGTRYTRQRAVNISSTGRISRWKYYEGAMPGPWVEQ